jgi:hypothetical protein
MQHKWRHAAGTFGVDSLAGGDFGPGADLDIAMLADRDGHF